MNAQVEKVVTSLITTAENKNLTGRQKANFVNSEIVDIVDGLVPLLSIIPDSIKEDVLVDGEDNIIAGLKELLPHLKDFVEECYQKIKHLFHKA
jgi:hypothetical protein